MKAALVISALLTLLIAMPASLYIQYQVLTSIGASQLVWFLYFVNIPIAILASIVGSLVRASVK